MISTRIIAHQTAMFTIKSINLLVSSSLIVDFECKINQKIRTHNNNEKKGSSS